MDLSVIITSFNTKNLLQDCLNSIFKQTKGIDFEVIIIDNASKDGSVAMVKKEFPQVNLIENKKNFGFAKANNQGIKQARGEYCLLLNSDTKIIKNALKKLIDFAKTKENLAVVGPKLLNSDQTPQPSVASFLTLPHVFLWLFTQDRFLYSSPSRAKEVDFVMGSALMVKKEIVKEVGLLDEKFFMYIEEQEWCYRIKKAGYQVWFYPGAAVYHLVQGSSPQGRQKVIWWIFKGLIYFYKKHFAPWQLSVLKFFLRVKAASAWLIGYLVGSDYLKKTYAKAFKLVR